ncbi:cutinase-domain-containing protein [Trichodelitschia bisporula]|uniref:Cutinase n=1 Tax=Trichodelitschia bisporula TaxID=703511 RepID=A0A6G1HPA6_9PEZI|nr:cutinase-domain-containing protein [Trichodelitschia bisporula]
MRNSIIAIGLFASAVFAAPNAAPVPQGKGLGGCKKVTLIFARGTTEMGTMGSTVGPALQRALEGKFPGQVKAEGVKYPADMGGAVSGAINPSGSEGAKQMAKMAKEALAACPDTKIILSGYSQGAEQVHGALMKTNLGEDGAKIAAAITYGDPMAGPTTKMIGGTWGCLPESRSRVFCNKGDGVCTGQFSISAAHLSYTGNGDINKGAAFAAEIVSKGQLGASPEGCKYGPTGPELQALLCANPPAGKGGAKGAKGKGGFGALFRRQSKGKGGGTPKLSCPPKDGAAPAAAAPGAGGE